MNTTQEIKRVHAEEIDIVIDFDQVQPDACRIKGHSNSVCLGQEANMATKSLTKSGLFSNALNSVRRLGDTKDKKSKRSKWEKEDLRSTCKCRRHNVQRHSYVFNEYVPDFENGCYRLQFQCEYCGDEIFDKVNDEYGGYYDGWKQTDTSEVATKYSKKQPEILVIYIQRIKLRGGGAVRIQHQEQRLEFNDN